MQDFITGKREEIAELCRTHHVRRLAVFGSAVRDDFDPTRSDIDVLVAFEPLSPLVLGRSIESLQDDLEQLLHRPVDLIREGTIRNSVRLRNIDRDKVLLYAA